MASYPNSVHTFTTKNAGDTIQPSHINDLQDEVNAIEAGILNGTANLNSSNATVVHMSVTAGMNVVGNSTLASTITIGTVAYQFPASAPTRSGQALSVQTTGAVSVLQWSSPIGLQLLAANDTEGTTASSNAYTALSTLSGFSIDSNTAMVVEYSARTSAAVAGASIQVQVNGATTIHQNSTATGSVGGINPPFSGSLASQGWFHLELGPRGGNYDRQVNGYGTCVDSTGVATIPAIIMGHGASTFTGTVTSVEIKGHSEGGVTLGVNHVRVYSKSVS